MSDSRPDDDIRVRIYSLRARRRWSSCGVGWPAEQGWVSQLDAFAEHLEAER
ncbi:MAG: hypothetical protein R2755_28495 [Acidimicrobiales bacterium]